MLKKSFIYAFHSIGDASKKSEKGSSWKICNLFYPDKYFRIVATNSFCRGISFVLFFKDVLPTTLCSWTVYCFTCPSCHTGYLSSTLLSLKNRIDEHLGQSARTSTPKISVFYDSGSLPRMEGSTLFRLFSYPCHL